jgi:hypothetical protein
MDSIPSAKMLKQNVGHVKGQAHASKQHIEAEEMNKSLRNYQNPLILVPILRSPLPLLHPVCARLLYPPVLAFSLS